MIVKENEFHFEETTEFYESCTEFNDFLDSSGDIHVLDYKYPPSQILFNVDNRAYLSELRSWQEGKRVEKVTYAAEVLNRDDNKHRINDLIKRLKSRRVLPFVGAGMSVPSGLPSWEKFLRSTADKCGVPATKVDELVSNGKYEECADAIIEIMKEDWFLQRFRYEFECGKGDVDGPIKLMPELFFTGVLTTNFDRLLELVYDGHQNSFKNVFYKITGDSLDFVSRGDSNLLKIHGHFELGDGRVLTSKEYDLAYGQEMINLNLVLPRFFKSISQSYCILFLGCSLKNDRVMKMLKAIKEEIKKDGGKSPEHFALISEPLDREAKIAQERFLIDHMIYPIWYPNEEHQYLDYIFSFIMDELGK